jgi:hypothetical protein
MQEALNVHFQGLCFRERNAGTAIDQHMTSYGFDNQIGVHPITGQPYVLALEYQLIFFFAPDKLAFRMIKNYLFIQ